LLRRREMTRRANFDQSAAQQTVQFYSITSSARPRIAAAQGCLLESAALNQNEILASIDFVHAA
jgi:hypothetical protein